MAELETIELEPRKVASLRREMSFDQISKAFDDLFWWIKSMGLTPVNPGIGICHTPPEKMHEDKVDFEVCLGFEGEAVSSGQVEVKTLEGGTFAQAVHKGPYDQVGPVYESLAAAVYSAGMSIAGPPREYYDVGPQQQATPDEFTTRVVFPVVKS